MVRTNNEDSYKLVPPLNLFVLADGMGGEAHGEGAGSPAVGRGGWRGRRWLSIAWKARKTRTRRLVEKRSRDLRKRPAGWPARFNLRIRECSLPPRNIRSGAAWARQ